MKRKPFSLESTSLNMIFYLSIVAKMIVNDFSNDKILPSNLKCRNLKETNQLCLPWFQIRYIHLMFVYSIFLRCQRTYSSHKPQRKMSGKKWKLIKRKWHTHTNTPKKRKQWLRYWKCVWYPRTKYVFIVISCITTIQFHKFVLVVFGEFCSKQKIWFVDDLCKFRSSFYFENCYGTEAPRAISRLTDLLINEEWNKLMKIKSQQ